MASNAGAHLLPEAGATQERRLEAVRCKPWLGAGPGRDPRLDAPRASPHDHPPGETQREPDFVRTVDLMARRGRMIVIAGRQAQPVVPVGPFYTRDLSLHGFAIFNASPDEQRACADDINRWLQQKKLRPVIGRTFPLAEAAAAHRLQEESSSQKSGALTGKIVLHP